MRKLTIGLVAAVAATGLAAPSASAKSVKPDCSSKLIKSANKHRAVVIKKHGSRSPGRDIVKYGITDNKRASCAQVREYRDTLVRLHTPVPVAQPVASTSSSAPVSAGGTTSGGSSNSMVDPSCESGGNPQVVDPSGTYWGKYQFDAGTWAAHGGDPSQYGSAPESVQDQIAANVQYDAWPNC